jgi:hypothetical protein
LIIDLEPHLAVTVNIRPADDLIKLLVGELVTEVSHDASQLSSGDQTVSVLVEFLGSNNFTAPCGPRFPPPTGHLCMPPCANWQYDFVRVAATQQARAQPPRLTMKASSISSSWARQGDDENGR